MIFTIGHTKSYKKYLKEATKDNPAKKMGRRSDYPGGSVWETFQDVSFYLFQHELPEFSIFGVLADWKTETISSSEGNWHDLLVDAEIIDLGELNEDWHRNNHL